MSFSLQIQTKQVPPTVTNVLKGIRVRKIEIGKCYVENILSWIEPSEVGKPTNGFFQLKTFQLKDVSSSTEAVMQY